MNKAKLHRIFQNIEMNPRDRKDLVNELSKGGSGGGVTIVNSVDKLDPNAKAGSLAVVSEGGGQKEYKCNELYNLDVNNDVLVDQTNMTITLLHPEKLNIINGININLPKNNVIVENVKTCMLLVGDLNAFSFINGGGDGTAVMVGATVKNKVVSGISCAIASNNTNKSYEIIVNDGNKYILNQEVLDSFISDFNAIDKTLYYFTEMGGGNLESKLYINEFVSFMVGDQINNTVLIKNEKWEEFNKNKFKRLEDIINTKQDPIKGIFNDNFDINYCEVNAGEYTVISDPSNNLIIKLNKYNLQNYKEYLIEISVMNGDVNLTFVDNNEEEIDLKWANQVSLYLETGYTYVISIVFNLGVFLKF